MQEGLTQRLFDEARVIRDAGWNGPAQTMLDAILEINELRRAAGVQVVPLQDFGNYVRDAVR